MKNTSPGLPNADANRIPSERVTLTGLSPKSDEVIYRFGCVEDSDEEYSWLFSITIEEETAAAPEPQLQFSLPAELRLPDRDISFHDLLRLESTADLEPGRPHDEILVEFALAPLVSLHLKREESAGGRTVYAELHIGTDIVLAGDFPFPEDEEDLHFLPLVEQT